MQLVHGVLNDSIMRRKLMLWMLLVLVAAIAVGTWLIEDSLSAGAVLFVGYWGAVFFGVLLLILFCVYDMLKTIAGK